MALTSRRSDVFTSAFALGAQRRTKASSFAADARLAVEKELAAEALRQRLVNENMSDLIARLTRAIAELERAQKEAINASA